MDSGSYQLPYLIAGLVVGLFGWLLYWAGIPIIAGVIGASAGGALGTIANDFVQAQAAWAPTAFRVTGVVLGAVLGILLMRAIQIYFFFTVGAAMGGALVWRLLYQSGGAPPQADLGMVVVILLGAVTGGLLTVYFRRFLVALSTSVIGVILLMYGLPPRYQLLGGLVGLVIFVSVQIGLVSRFVERDDFDRRMRRHKEALADDLDE